MQLLLVLGLEGEFQFVSRFYWGSVPRRQSGEWLRFQKTKILVTQTLPKSSVIMFLKNGMMRWVNFLCFRRSTLPVVILKLTGLSRNERGKKIPKFQFIRMVPF